MQSLRLLALLALAACGETDPATTPASEASQRAPQASPEPAAPAAPEPASLAGSLLANGDFETGRAPWFSYDKRYMGTFGVTQGAPTIGARSAVLTLDEAGAVRDGMRLTSCAQDLPVTTLPATLAGRYYIETWEPGDARPWIEVCIAVERLDALPARKGYTQMGYPLAGVIEPTFKLANRRNVGPGTNEVVTGRWIDFELPVQAAFAEHWNLQSDECKAIRVWCTTRVHAYDAEARPPFAVKVRFDDLRLLP